MENPELPKLKATQGGAHDGTIAKRNLIKSELLIRSIQNNDEFQYRHLRIETTVLEPIAYTVDGNSQPALRSIIITLKEVGEPDYFYKVHNKLCFANITC